ncbi:MAG: DUF1552 domain-containing protein [Vicinamibacterales bacterium]|nr:DUF1552 domain-containing protein [Vicinamibacterales bacterium]
MNLIFKKQLPRRTFLRGMGGVLALPVLDAMMPALVKAAATAAPSRMAILYFPNGVQVDSWKIKSEGLIAKLPDVLPRTLEPLAKYRNDFSILSGLTVNGGRALGDGPGDHGRAGASYLTGAHPKKTFGKDLEAGVSMDQQAARAIGSATRFASLELGCEEGIQGGNCDNGYSCAYSNSISWRTPSTPNPPEIRPRAVFERLFGAGDVERDPKVRARQEKYQKSVLDSVLGDAKRLEGVLGASDRRKLDEYMYAVRDIETRIQKTEKTNATNPDLEKPLASVPENYNEHTRIMFDLMTAALQTDSTRVVTFLMAIEQSNRAYREIGIADSHHGLTHHGGDKEKIEKCIQINRYQVEQFAYFIDKLKVTRDGDGTLFDHTMVTYGSGLGKDHDHDDLPTVITGRGNGLFTLGRHVTYPNETPLANLHVSMMNQLGIPAEQFADSTGKLGYLSDL